MDALRLVELGNRYIITRNVDADTQQIDYDIESKVSSIACSIDLESRIKYYVTGVYNSGSQYAEIEMDALMELKEFAELIIKFNDRGE